MHISVNSLLIHRPAVASPALDTPPRLGLLRKGGLADASGSLRQRLGNPLAEPVVCASSPAVTRASVGASERGREERAGEPPLCCSRVGVCCSRGWLRRARTAGGEENEPSRAEDKPTRPGGASRVLRADRTTRDGGSHRDALNRSAGRQ